jgi:hypothetical protein
LTRAELAALDAQLAATEHTPRQSFYTDRARSCPFFVPHPRSAHPTPDRCQGYGA